MPDLADERLRVRSRCHDGPVQLEFSRPAGEAIAWVDELPTVSVVSSVGQVTGYWRWRGTAPASAIRRAAGWGYRAGFGGRGEYGVLGATFEPHEYPYLAVHVATTVDVGSPAPGKFGGARVGLPFGYVGGVLAGALQEPERVGPGTLRFEHAAVHEVDSSWEVFRLLAVGVVRLVGLPTGGDATGLLPRFGGSTPESPGAD